MRATQKQGRARGRGQRKPNGNNVNRVYDSSGPEGKVRGTPQQIVEKYLTLARDAQTAGDRVTSENFLQHAEHYQRILIQAAAQNQPERRDGEGDGGEANGTSGNGSGSEAETGSDGGGDRQEARAEPRRERQEGQRHEGQGQESQGDPRQGSTVGGLDTIDAEGDGSSLLVEDETEQSQPKPARKRQRRPKAESGETGTEAAANGKAANGSDGEAAPTGDGAAEAPAKPRRSRARKPAAEDTPEPVNSDAQPGNG